MAEPRNLDEAYEWYKSGRHGRGDLFLFYKEAIKELQARIGAVDEAAVAALDGRLGALETVIGNALRWTEPPVAVSPTDPRCMVPFAASEPKKRGGWPKGRPRNGGKAAPAQEAANA